jgi:hypothetical protein
MTAPEPGAVSRAPLNFHSVCCSLDSSQAPKPASSFQDLTVLILMKWAVDDEMGDDGVVVGASREGGRGTGLGMQSFMSMKTVMDAVEMVSGDGDRKPGSSGWTKLKPR